MKGDKSCSPIKMTEGKIKTPSTGARKGDSGTGKVGSKGSSKPWTSGHNKGSQDR